MRAAAVAARHLRALGCAVEQDGARLTARLTARPPDGPPAGPPAVQPVVHCEIGWAGPVGLPLADEAGVQAACGLMHVHGRRHGGPVPLGLDYASVAAGVLAAQGVLAALIAQLRGSPARHVGTSVAEAALLTVGQYLAAATTGEEAGPLLPGGPPFVSADGVRFEIETLAAEDWLGFWSLLGAPRAAVSQGWRPFESRYATATCPLPPPLHEATARLGYPVVAEYAARAGVSVMPVSDTPDLAMSSGRPPWSISPVPGAAATSRTATPQAGAPWAVAPPPAAPWAPAPGLTGLPLAGLVAVESTSRVQGPLAGRVLAMLGARVIRIEPPGGDPMRGIPPVDGDCSARFRALNRGKEAVEIDIKSPAGRQRLLRLVADADVFVHNWPPGRAARLQLDAGQLLEASPRLVYAWASGWGDTLGPTPPLGTDFMVQAYSGLGAVLRSPGQAPTPSLMTLTDVLGGLICAQGTLAALLAAGLTGAGQRVHSSLLSAATVLLDEALLAEARGPQGAISQIAVPAAASVPVCTDLAALGADPRFAAALCADGAVYPRAPWRFAA